MRKFKNNKNFKKYTNYTKTNSYFHKEKKKQHHANRFVFDKTKTFESSEDKTPRKIIETVTNMDFERVTVESIEILDDMHRVEKKNCNDVPEEKETELVDSKQKVSIKKKTQGDIDREIVNNFYANPTPEMFAGIWKRFYYGVHSHAYKIYGDWERAADAVGDTFQKAWEKKDTFDPNLGNYSTWLYTICYNICISNIKKESVGRAIDIDVSEVFDSTTYNNYANNTDLAITDNKYYTSSIDGSIEENNFEEIEQKIYDASVFEIKKMDPLFQQIIEMKDAKDMTLREIAEKLGIKESKVKNCYYKNREILADVIQKKYGDLYGIYKEAMKDRLDSEEVYNIYKNSSYTDDEMELLLG